MRIEKHLSFVLMASAVAAVAIIVGVLAGRGASVSNAAVNGSATIAVVPPGGSQAIGVPFTVPVNLVSFTPGTSLKWGGWGLDLVYDPAVLQANGDVVGPLLCPAASWFNQTLGPPDIISGCFSQSSATTSGLMETITFQCKTNGLTALTMANTGDGTFLFDESAINFVMTLTNGSVTCGTGGPTPTFTNTATATNTPTATNTAGPTNTATNTFTPTNTPLAGTQTARAQATQTSVSGTQTAQADVIVSSATPTGTILTGSETATPVGGTTGTPIVPGTTPPLGTGNPNGGGAAGAGRVRLPDTGDGTTTRTTGMWDGLWLILAATIVLGSLGGAMYVKSRRVD